MSKVQVKIWSMEIPLDPPIISPSRVSTHTWVLLVELINAKGERGVGYSSFRDRPALDACAPLARKLADGAKMDDKGAELSRLLEIERIEEDTLTPSVASKSAANALSMAAWDLAGVQTGKACADLWGRPSHRKGVGCYGSALWMDKNPEQLTAEAKELRAINYRMVKMRVGKSTKDNLARIAAVQKVYSEPKTIALETGFSWGVELANEFIREAPGEYLWIEDPAPYDVMREVKINSRNIISAGEKCTTFRQLADLYAHGNVPNLIIDVQCVGGPVRFLEAARALHAMGAHVGGHRFSHHSLHLLAALPDSMPVEMLDWTNPAIPPLSGPDASGNLPVGGPGFGTQLDDAVVRKYGVAV
jgi:L-alanine-DL-glutamate epimerase-like enolase superfamily enzyme